METSSISKIKHNTRDKNHYKDKDTAPTWLLALTKSMHDAKWALNGLAGPMNQSAGAMNPGVEQLHPLAVRSAHKSSSQVFYYEGKKEKNITLPRGTPFVSHGMLFFVLLLL